MMAISDIVKLFSHNSDFMNSMMGVGEIPTYVMPCISWFFRYVPENENAIFLIFNPRGGVNMLLGVPHWHAPHLTPCPRRRQRPARPRTKHLIPMKKRRSVQRKLEAQAIQKDPFALYHDIT